VLVALALTLMLEPATGARPHDPAARCGGHTITVKQARPFITTVWGERHWSRGSPGPKARKAWRHKLKCAAGPGHRKAMKRRWRKAKRSYLRHAARIRAQRCGEPECNRRLAEAIAGERGYGPGEIECLHVLGDHESDWDETATNPTSGAEGIPQALPGSKLGDAIGSGWRVAAGQIRWMLDYLRERYGSPCGGWSFWLANGWY
jgi:hypothetical protein